MTLLLALDVVETNIFFVLVLSSAEIHVTIVETKIIVRAQQERKKTAARQRRVQHEGDEEAAEDD